MPRSLSSRTGSITRQTASGENSMSEEVDHAAVRLCARYAAQDVPAWLELETYLAGLKSQGLKLAWSHHVIGSSASDEDPADHDANRHDSHQLRDNATQEAVLQDNATQDNLLQSNAAQINLLLVSPALLKTAYCQSEELQQLIQAHRQRRSRLIPVLLESVDLNQTSVDQLSVLPSDATPVNHWSNRIQAFQDIAAGIREIAFSLCGVATIPSVARTASASDDIHEASAESDERMPRSIGRYAVKQILGEGTYGRVYLAEDADLDRDVAIKVPHPHRVTMPSDVQTYLREARLVAKLDHPNLVPVYDLGYTEDGRCYVVSKLIQGKDLRQRLDEEAFSFLESARLIAEVAEALDYAHQRELVHRDIKPANILIDNEGNSFVADFGLAIREDDFGKGTKYAGTPAYMSPEQARGEGHRVDARSDIFSLGAVLYEMITGRRAFRSDRLKTLLKEIATSDARPPRQIEPNIPRELERICLKAIANRLTDRYTTAADLAEDLRYFIDDHLDEEIAHQVPTRGHSRDGRRRDLGSSRPASSRRAHRRSSRGTDRSRRSSMRGSRHGSHHDSSELAIKVVPKGLRPFDDQDSNFFLELLPGSRDRDGIPESIRSWKKRIEPRDLETPFEVGLIYGPSGCGKSSFVRAGLLPLLEPDVIPLFLEASATETESQLRNGLQARCHRLPKELDLVGAVAAVRRGEGLDPHEKLLIVIDQFEQWLHTHGEDLAQESLLNALRQCDGHTVQALLLVRVDYMMGIHRFMQELEVRIEEGRNAAAVDLFDKAHAKRVLAEFGRAYQCLPDKQEATTKSQRAFLDQAVDELADDDKVVPVHLTVFTEMMKGREWNQQTLKELGGSTGVGIKFLEETFESVSAPMPNRLHEKAARQVLNALMPPIGTDIRGGKKSYRELMQVSGYADRPNDFAALITILDRDLRLITPTDPQDDAAEASDPSYDAYELTHDYLVPSLRDWLTRKQRETRQGRAQIRLEERSTIWSTKPQNRHLPALWEYLNIRWFTRPSNWTQPQRNMMNKAARYHGLRSGATVVALGMLLIAGYFVNHRIAALREQWKVDGLVTAVERAKLTELEQLVGELVPFRAQIEQRLRERLDQSLGKDIATMINYHIVLLGAVDGHEHVDPIFEYFVGRSQPNEIPSLRTFLRGKEKAKLQALWDTLERSADHSAGHRLRAASGLAAFEPSSNRWSTEVLNDVAALLVSVHPSRVGQWVENLAPIGDGLLQPLRTIYLNDDSSMSERTTAADVLCRYAPDQADDWVQLLMHATNGRQMTLFVEKLEAHGPDATAKLRTALAELLEESTRLEAEYEQALQQTDDLSEARQVKQFEWDTLAVDKESVDADAAARSTTLARDIESLDQRLKALNLTLRKANQSLEELATQAANVGVALLRLGDDEPVWPLLVERPDQRRRTYLIHRVNQMSVTPRLLINAFREFSEATDRDSVSIRQALLLCLGTYFTDARISGDIKASLLELESSLVNVFEHDPDPGIHGAARWLLARMGRGERVASIEANLRGKPPAAKRWYIDNHGHTMIIFPAEVREFVMGSPISEKGRERGLSLANENIYEKRHLRRIDWGFAVSATEVTLRQFLEFAPQHRYANDISPTPDCPVNYPTWYDAVAYCNWLSDQAGIPPSEHCYTLQTVQRFFPKRTERQCRIADGFLDRMGYRLVTEIEWEYVCRAGSTTSRHYGESEVLLANYACFAENAEAEDETRPVASLMPNDWGFFDLYGNVSEWCHDHAGDFSKRNMIGAWPEREAINGHPPIVQGDGLRSIRGRGFNSPAARLRSASRDSSRPIHSYYAYGFRVARSLPTNTNSND